MTPRATASQNPRPEAISHNHVDSAIPVAARGTEPADRSVLVPLSAPLFRLRGRYANTSLFDIPSRTPFLGSSLGAAGPQAGLTTDRGGKNQRVEGIAIASAVIGLVGTLVWLGLLLWAAREDGRDQRRRDERTSGL